MRWISTGILLAALALSGCGQTAERDAVRTATERFYAAVGSHDGARACAQLSEETIKQLELSEKAKCADAVGSLGLSPTRVTHVEVFVTNAKVDLANGASAFLDETAAGWKLSALGCRPTNGNPQEQPMGCAVES
jgi:hypothetical protein